MSRRYWIETHGCQMNVHDSERIAGLLEEAGYQSATTFEEADVVVLNTCSVRERAEEKLFTRLGEIRMSTAASDTPPILVVAGCVAQQEGADIAKRSKLVDIVLGTQAIRRLPMLVEQVPLNRRAPLVDLNPHDDVSFPLGLVRRHDPVKAYVTIIEGCNEFCAFCVVPYTRGHERMRSAADILSEVRAAADAGHSEIQLLGQIVNHYRAPDDKACDFAELLSRIDAVPGVRRIRFASPHPRHVDRHLIAAIRDLPGVCKHLHLPVQSGSTDVLNAMRRRYTRDEYLSLVWDVRSAIPDICLSTDMIVGFPGETDAQFEETLSLTRAVEYHSMFSFKYSPRPNTLAIKRMRDDVPEEEKTRRIVALQSVQREIQTRLHRQRVGSIVDVLVDSRSKRHPTELAGRTTGNTVVNFHGSPDLLGRLVPVRVTRAGPNSLAGEVASPGDQLSVAPEHTTLGRETAPCP